ncbi:MAG TPA: cell division protein CrgA [Actinomycetota bacterium]
MPKSKSKRSRYQAPSPPKPRPSPRWVAPVILSILFAGVLVIVLNYLGLIPGTGGQARNLYLWIGLGMIAVGFGAATRLR